MAYQHIQRLDERALALADTEIPALTKAIADYRQYLPEENWKAFQERVAREWAIETGQIEGLYQFDRGLTIELIEHGITLSRIPASASQMSPEQVMAILSDHQSTLEGLFAFVKGERALSKSYIHEVHQALLRNQKVYRVFAAVTHEYFEKVLVSGRYKDQPNSPTRPDGSILDFCPPEHVEAEMDQLMRLHREHEAEGVPVEIQAAWLHHAFTHIHPYPDGNGRVARALATLVLIKGGLMPLVVPTTEKQLVYIPALERADDHDYSSLVRAIRLWQGRLVVDLSQRIDFGEPRRAATIDEFVAGVEHDLLRQEIKLPPSWASRTQPLSNLAANQLGWVAAGLKKAAQPTGWGFRHGTEHPTTDARNLLGPEVIAEVAVLLELQSPKDVQIQILLGRYGPKIRGLGLAAACLVSQGQYERLGCTFLINFAEEQSGMESRFQRWLEPVVLEGLNHWRRQNLGGQST